MVKERSAPAWILVGEDVNGNARSVEFKVADAFEEFLELNVPYPTSIWSAEGLEKS
jgi:hypothetical protein